MQSLRVRLVNKGYTQTQNRPISRKYAGHLFQKRIKSGVSTLYFVNIYSYAPSKHIKKWAYEVEATYWLAENDHLDVTWVCNDETTVSEIEARASMIYDNLNCIPDVLNQ